MCGIRLSTHCETRTATEGTDIGNVQETGIEGLVIPNPLLRDLTMPPTRVKTSPPVKGAMDGSIVVQRACGRLLRGGRGEV